jgi:ferric-dicitrate binding protein FerR (iron transport regulator)
MDHTQQLIKEIITRFLEGTATELDVQQLREWLHEDEANRRYFDEVNTAYQASVTLNRYNQQKIDRAWQKLANRIEEEQFQGEPQRREREWKLPFIKLAASVLLVTISGFIAYKLLSQKPPVKGLNTLVLNTAGKNQEIYLPDGSSVWLNADSELEYTPTFGKSDREIKLKGEAFFDVVKSKVPFIVHTGNIQILVRGTKFNVQAHQGDSAIMTTLEEGKIELRVIGNTSLYTMTPGEQITLNTAHNKLTRKRVNPSDFSAWKEQRLVFDNTSLQSIISKLENRYKVHIETEDALMLRERLTMTIEDESLDEVLEMIRLSSHLKTKKENNHITFYK